MGSAPPGKPSHAAAGGTVPAPKQGEAGKKGEERRHILTCCSIFVNIVNHGLADGNVNCTCGSNKTSRLITFTNSDRGCGTAEDSPPPARKVPRGRHFQRRPLLPRPSSIPRLFPSAVAPSRVLRRQRCSLSQSPSSLRKPHRDPAMDWMEWDFFRSR